MVKKNMWYSHTFSIYVHVDFNFESMRGRYIFVKISYEKNVGQYEMSYESGVFAFPNACTLGNTSIWTQSITVRM